MVRCHAFRQLCGLLDKGLRSSSPMMC
jgi:hypothetical protein